MSEYATTDRLCYLLSLCKYGAHITVNGHRDNYETAEKAIEARESLEELDITAEARQRMIDTDTIVNVNVYHDSPVGAYDIYHHDITAAINAAIECIEAERKGLAK